VKEDENGKKTKEYVKERKTMSRKEEGRKEGREES
jgi:hypothetical protein